MAEIKVAIKGDDSDFKAKMAESGAEARHFAEQVKESFDKSKEAAADMMGEAGFGGIKKVLTGAGVVAFGAGIIEAFKHGAEAAIDFEDKVSKLRSTLGVAQAGMADDIAKWIESNSGIMGSIEENMAAFNELKRSGMTIPEAQSALINIQNAARETGSSIEELTRGFAEMKVSGKVPERFFRENIGIAERAKNMLGPEVAPDAAFMLRSLLPSYGGLQSQTRIEAQATTAGQLANLSIQFEELNRELGTALLPTIKEFVGDIRAAMPEITETVKHWSEDLKEALDSVHKNLGWLGRDIVADRYPGQRTVEGLHDKLAAMFADHTQSALELKMAAQEQHASAQEQHALIDALHRAVNPQ